MEREALIAMVQGMKNGEEAAFNQMYQHFYKDLHYYIYKTVNDSDLADDLTQDSFMEILQSIHSLQEPAAFYNWSRRIAYRRCTAHFRKKHELLADEDEEGYSVFDTLEEDRREFIPDEALDKEELKQTIHQILNSLPEEQRSAVMMRYFDEISVADIATIQNVAEGTVKSRLNYARKAIKAAVEAYESKHQTKLHSMGILPILLWMLRQQRLEQGLSLTTGQAKIPMEQALAAAKAGAAPAASASGVGAAAVPTAAAGKTVGAALMGKIAAGIVAAALVAGGTLWGIGALSSPQESWEEHTEETAEKTSDKTPASSSAPASASAPFSSDASFLPPASTAPNTSQAPSSTQAAPPATTLPAKGARFDGEEFFTVYADGFEEDLKQVHRYATGVLYVETADGKLYHSRDKTRENDLLGDGNLASWQYGEHTGLITVDENGYYRIDGRLAHSIRGEILYSYYSSFSGELCVYSVDEHGYVYFNAFRSTGKKSADNEALLFYEKDDSGKKTAFDTVEEIRVLPHKGSYYVSPDVLIRLNGKTYVDKYFSYVTLNQLILNTSLAVSDEAAKGMLDYDPSTSYKITYSKEGIDDRLFCRIGEDDYLLLLPDGHTVDEIAYFNRGSTDLLVFTNGDVYLWEGSPSILGEHPQKHEGLSRIGSEIQEIFYCGNSYRILMSDNVIYLLTV